MALREYNDRAVLKGSDNGDNGGSGDNSDSRDNGGNGGNGGNGDNNRDNGGINGNINGYEGNNINGDNDRSNSNTNGSNMGINDTDSSNRTKNEESAEGHLINLSLPLLPRETGLPETQSYPLRETGLREPLLFSPIRELYPHFRYEDIAAHPAIIILPYQVSFISYS